MEQASKNNIKCGMANVNFFALVVLLEFQHLNIWDSGQLCAHADLLTSLMVLSYLLLDCSNNLFL